MTTAELIALASPPCHRCGMPVQRVEQQWHRDGDGVWRIIGFMVCRDDHRIMVEPIAPPDSPVSDGPLG